MKLWWVWIGCLVSFTRSTKKFVSSKSSKPLGTAGIFRRLVEKLLSRWIIMGAGFASMLTPNLLTEPKETFAG